MLSDTRIVKKVFDWKAPKRTSSSPIKLLVPGKPILQNEKKKKKITNKGITCTNPP